MYSSQNNVQSFSTDGAISQPVTSSSSVSDEVSEVPSCALNWNFVFLSFLDYS